MRIANELQRMKRIVITGGPGCGKSSVLAELGRRGCLVMPETFRWLKVLAEVESFKAEALPQIDGQDFLRRLLAFQRYTEDEESSDQFCFYDRSTLDLVAYTCFYSASLSLSGTSDSIPLLDKYARRFAKEIHKAFLISLPQVSIEHDWLRQNSLEESILIEKQLRETYAQYGVELIALGRGAIPALCNSIYQCLGITPDAEVHAGEHSNSPGGEKSLKPLNA